MTFSGESALQLSSTTAVTDPNGLASITVTSTQAGSYNLNAKTPQDRQGKSVAIGFSGDKATASVESISATPEKDITADGITKSQIVATIKDAGSNLVQGGEVNFTGNIERGPGGDRNGRAGEN